MSLKQAPEARVLLGQLRILDYNVADMIFEDLEFFIFWGISICMPVAMVRA